MHMLKHVIQYTEVLGDSVDKNKTLKHF